MALLMLAYHHNKVIDVITDLVRMPSLPYGKHLNVLQLWCEATELPMQTSCTLVACIAIFAQLVAHLFSLMVPADHLCDDSQDDDGWSPKTSALTPGDLATITAAGRAATLYDGLFEELFEAGSAETGASVEIIEPVDRSTGRPPMARAASCPAVIPYDECQSPRHSEELAARQHRSTARKVSFSVPAGWGYPCRDGPYRRPRRVGEQSCRIFLAADCETATLC